MSGKTGILEWSLKKVVIDGVYHANCLFFFTLLPAHHFDEFFDVETGKQTIHKKCFNAQLASFCLIDFKGNSVYNHNRENSNVCCSKFMSLPVYLQKDRILPML